MKTDNKENGKKSLRLAAIISVLPALLMLASCAVEKKPESQITPVSPSKLVFEIGGKDSFVPAPKKEYGKEEQALLDSYYLEMIEKYPSFKEIPREMLREYIRLPDEDYDYLSVSFSFFFGGINTKCSCTFSTSPAYPDGNWEIRENGFMNYCKLGLTNEQVDAIQKLLFDSALDYIDEYKLEKPSPDEVKNGFYWYIHDGQIYAEIEYLPDVTEETTKEFGCGDHAHVFAHALVEIGENEITVNLIGVSGS